MSDVDRVERTAEDAGSDERSEEPSPRTTAAHVQAPEGAPEPPREREFGRGGWLLLGMLFVAFFVVPALIYFRPPGVSFTFAYLVLPLLPATALALLAVWVATR